MWNEGYLKQNTSFEELLEKFYWFLKENTFDRIILTRFEEYKLGGDYCFYSEVDGEYHNLGEFVETVKTYDYGWDKDSIFDGELPEPNLNGFYENEYGNLYCDGGSHSEIVWIPDWMFNLQGEVFISGAFDNECIEDLEMALSGASKKFTRIEELIV